MMQKIYNFFKEHKEKGQSIIEYGILLAVIATAIIAFQSNNSMKTEFENLNKSIGSAISAGGTYVSVSAKT
ncbi:MAG: hypothetical protein IJ668_09250 [Selenomonadaceae bacterium]|nr:hypothetical protein [Selenomonadaceae bacterium]